MKPRTQLEKDFFQLLQEDDYYTLTNNQLQAMREIVEREQQKICVGVETYYPKYKIRSQKVYALKLNDKKGKLLTYHLCVADACRDGNYAIASRNRNMSSCYCDVFSWDSSMQIRSHRDVYSYYLNNCWAIKTAKESHPYDVIRQVNGNYYVYRSPEAETIDKSRFSFIIDKLASCQRPISSQLFTAIRMCLRNNYEIGEWWNYMRYINLCYANKQDIHNPKIACPTNFSESLAKIIHANDRRRLKLAKQRAEKERIDAARKLIEERKRNEIAEESYAKRVGGYLAVVIADDMFDISVLQSVKEFKEEGDIMGHCVFVNEYYKKADTLIFSVRDKQGCHVATIEFDLKHRTIVQCRGHHNHQPKDYDHIINLFNNSKRKIRKSTSKAV